jgi:hypothetical protein
MTPTTNPAPRLNGQVTEQVFNDSLGTESCEYELTLGPASAPARSFSLASSSGLSGIGSCNADTR